MIVFDRKHEAKSTRDVINNNSMLSIGHREIKDKFLWDILNEEGLSKSVEATIDRYVETFTAINEIGSVMNHFRIDQLDSIWGLKAGLDIFELCFILEQLRYVV